MPSIPGLENINWMVLVGKSIYWLGIILSGFIGVAIIGFGYYLLSFNIKIIEFPLYGTGKDGKFSIGKPTIAIAYTELVTIVTATLNGEDISNLLTTQDDMTFSFTPGQNLTNGDYILEIKVKDDFNNTRTDSMRFTIDVVDTSIQPGDQAGGDEQGPSLIMIVAIVIIAVIIVIALLFKVGFLYVEDVPEHTYVKKTPEKPKKTSKKSSTRKTQKKKTTTKKKK